MTAKTGIIWLGPQRFIPDVGMVSADPKQLILVEVDKGKSFVKQGLAKYPERKPKATQEVK